jgi:hypothetical protein
LLSLTTTSMGSARPITVIFWLFISNEMESIPAEFRVAVAVRILRLHMDFYKLNSFFHLAISP